MIDVGIDFETYYDSTYTLKDFMIPQYVLDYRFETIGVSIKIANTPARWYPGDAARVALSKLPWNKIRVTAHHAFFDAAVLEWVYGHKPAQYFCSMMASRPYVAPYTGSMSLAAVSKHLGTGEKGHEVLQAKGKQLADFTPDELHRYGVYCCNDNELCCADRDVLLEWLPPDELELIDLTVKKFTRPVLTLDQQAITARYADLRVKREFILTRCQLLDVSEEDLRSRAKFAKALKRYGVTPPKKVSARTGKETHAFANNDQEFADMLVHSDERIRTLVEAKLFMSSTMEEGRLQRFSAIHHLDIGGKNQLPVPLLYYGAHPGRFSGYDKINLQNLTRVARDKATGAVTAGHLRFALRAPPGHVVVAGDLSNIEARIVATLAKCTRLVQDFRDKVDTYSKFAERIYGRPIDKNRDPIERFVGKTCILGLGYGMGSKKFHLQMGAARVKMDYTIASRIVYLYRDTYQEIPQLWGILEQKLAGAAQTNCIDTLGPISFVHERILLPNGMPITYPGLSTASGGLSFKSRRGYADGASGDVHLWGGAITENVVQALARIVISTAELRLARAGLKAALQVHDELVYVVPEQFAEKVKRAIEIAMTIPVSWMPDLPLACEVHYGQTYGDAK